MTPEQLVEAIPRVGRVTADFWAPLLTSAMDRFGIDSAAQQAGFIAQASHESSNFSQLVENLNYKTARRLCTVFPSRFKTLESATPYLRSPRKLGDLIYAPRGTRLPESSGGGFDHRGRGLFHITWLANYLRVGHGLGLNLADNPSLLEEPAHAAASAAWWWMDLKLNQYADRFEIDKITRAINGPGMMGRVERAQTFARAITAFS